MTISEDDLFEERVPQRFLNEGEMEKLMEYAKSVVVDMGDIHPMVIFGNSWADDHWAVSPELKEDEHPIDTLGKLLMIVSSFGFGAAGFLAVNMRPVNPEEDLSETSKTPVSEHINSSEAVMIMEVLGAETIQQGLVTFGRDDRGVPHNFNFRVMDMVGQGHDGTNWGDMLTKIEASQVMHRKLMESAGKDPERTFLKASEASLKGALRVFNQKATVVRILNGGHEVFDIESDGLGW